MPRATTMSHAIVDRSFQDTQGRRDTGPWSGGCEKRGDPSVHLRLSIGAYRIERGNLPPRKSG
jgi:hypothetical protein